MISIRKYEAADRDALWAILEPVILAGETYDFPRNTGKEAALADWLDADNRCYVAEDQGHILGTYVLHANRRGGGSHVANCGYMTAADAHGRGIASAMCAHSLAEASALGFQAMQFNFVIASNHRAVALWQRMGFQIVGRIPDAFLHPALGYTDALVMHQKLAAIPAPPSADLAA